MTTSRPRSLGTTKRTRRAGGEPRRRMCRKTRHEIWRENGEGNSKRALQVRQFLDTGSHPASPARGSGGLRGPLPSSPPPRLRTLPANGEERERSRRPDAGRVPADIPADSHLPRRVRVFHLGISHCVKPCVDAFSQAKNNAELAR